MSEEHRALPGQARALRVVERLTRFGFSASATFSDVAVLDGVTLTGHGVIRDLRRGAYRSVALVFERSNGTTRTARVEVRPLSDDTVGVVCAVALDGPDGITMRKGLWRVGVEIETPRGLRRAVPTTGAVLDPGRPAPTLWNPRSRSSGRRYEPSVGEAGGLHIRVHRFRPHAEVEQVEIDGRTVGLTGRVIAPPAVVRAVSRSRGAALVVARRGARQRRRFALQVADGRFSARVPLDRLPLGVDRQWVARIVLPDGLQLPLRRVLSDLADPAAAHRYPSVRLPRRIQMTPTYDAEGTLLLRTARRPSPAPEAPA